MIRAKNVDLQTEYFKGHVEASLGDLTATRNDAVFVAPYACKVETIDIYSLQGVSGASDVNVAFALINPQTTASSTIASRGTSATAGTSDDLIANSRYRINVTSNNSLTQGSILYLTTTVAGSAAAISGVVCHVRYTFNKHRESR